MDVLELMNPWWKTGGISEELALPYKRKQFQELKKLLSLRPVTLISGLRRVGKSVLMYQLIEWLIASNVNPGSILYFSFDQKVEELLEVLGRYKELAGKDWENSRIYVFFDEIQKLDDWSNKLKLLYDRFPSIKFMVSGSSSFNLEKDAIKNLAGRYFGVNVKPLSFVEYLELRKSKIDVNKRALWESEIRGELKHYLLTPYPEIVNYNEQSLIKSYIKENVVDKILKQDLSRFRDINEELATSLVDTFYDSPGMYVNYDKLSADLGISKKTLLRHVYYLELSFLIRRVRNFRPATRTTSRKLQRIYPYHFSLMFGWNGKLTLESEMTSLYDSKYYWSDGRREVDMVLVGDDRKLIPIEVKEAKRLGESDLASMRYFMTKFKASKGFVVYDGKNEKLAAKGYEIELLPAWHAFLDLAVKRKDDKD